MTKDEKQTLKMIKEYAKEHDLSLSEATTLWVEENQVPERWLKNSTFFGE